MSALGTGTCTSQPLIFPFPSCCVQRRLGAVEGVEAAAPVEVREAPAAAPALGAGAGGAAGEGADAGVSDTAAAPPAHDPTEL